MNLHNPPTCSAPLHQCRPYFLALSPLSPKQAWSIVFPSWLTLILLLWACIIWIFPFVYPNAAILFTAPFLVPYSCCLLVLHYMTFLSLNSSERNNTGLMILQENQVVPTANTEEKERYFPYVFMQVQW